MTLDASLKLKLVDEVSAAARQMADRIGVVGQAGDDAAKVAAAAFEEMRIRQLEAGEEATRLAAKLRELKASGNATEEEIREISAALVRAREEARRYGQAAQQIQKAHEQASRATEGATAATKSHGAASHAASRATANAIANSERMLHSLGSLTPQTHAIAGAFRGAATTAASLAHSMGPIGVIAGTAIAVLPNLVSTLRDVANGQRETRDETERTNLTYLEQIDLVERLRREHQREAELLDGRASVERTENAITEARSDLAEQQGRARAVVRRVTVDAQGRTRSDASGIEQAIARLAEAGVSANPTERVDQARAVLEAMEREGVQLGGTAHERRTRAAAVAQGALEASPIQREIEAQQQHISRLEAALRQAQTREEGEEREAGVREVQEAAGRARQELTDFLRLARSADGRALTDRQRSQLTQAAETGQLTDAQRRLLGEGGAAELSRISGLVRGREDEAARLRRGLARERVDLLEEPTPEPVAQRVRQRAQRRFEGPFVAPPPGAAPDRGPAGLSEGSLRVLVEVSDDRVTARVRGDGVDVDASSASLGGRR